MSSQQVSIKKKTSMLFTRGVSTNMHRHLVDESGFREVHSLGKYIGVPLTERAPRIIDFDYHVDMLKNILTS